MNPKDRTLPQFPANGIHDKGRVVVVYQSGAPMPPQRDLNVFRPKKIMSASETSAPANFDTAKGRGRSDK
jgi:hypothetical protein